MMPTSHLKGDTSESLQKFYVLPFLLESDTLKGKNIKHIEYKKHSVNICIHNLLKVTVLSDVMSRTLERYVSMCT